MKVSFVALAAMVISCGPVPAPKPIQPAPAPKPPVATDVVTCAVAAVQDAQGIWRCPLPVPNVPVHLHVATNPDVYMDGVTNSAGYFVWTVPDVRRPLPFADVKSDAVSGWRADDIAIQVEPPAPNPCSSLSPKECHNILTLIGDWPQPQPRGPLVLEPNDQGTGDVCPHIPPTGMVVPDGPDLLFWRGDAWGVTVPGAPFVAGGSSRHPERVLSWFIDRYSDEWQTRILNAHRARGYTHFTLSWPDSRDGAGQSAQQFAATAKRVNAAIPFIHVMLTSKDFDFPHNADAATQMARVSPAMDALIAAGFTKSNLIPALGWELDAHNQGNLLEDFAAAFAAKYPGFHLAVHFQTYKTSWQPDGQPRAQFWLFLRSVLRDGARPILLYQGNQNDPCGLMAAHFNDAQIPASGIEEAGGVLVAWELVAANEFDGDHPTEDDANARVWEVMNTPGRVLASGGGNGWRFPDGRPALRAYPARGVQ